MKGKLLILLGIIFSCQAAEPVYSRIAEDHDFKPAARKRLTGKTFVYAERQPYLPYQNFLHHWMDRPLFTDVSLRKTEDPQKAGFLHDVNIVKNYGLDGFASLSYYGPHLNHLKYLKEAEVTDYSQMMVIGAGADYGQTKEHIMKILESPYTPEIHGKPFFWSYGSPDKIQEFVRRARADFTKDFYFFGPVPYLKLYHAFYEYAKQDLPVPASLVDEFRRETQEALDLYGALLVRTTELYRPYRGEYGYRTGAADWYRKYVLPTVLELMQKPENEGKMLGAYIRHGYTNHMNGPVHSENGTQALRTDLDEAVMMNPDTLMLFEWNEANENTSFQPTVANGRALERILNYYMQRLNNQPYTPRPGDNPDAPNLILSSRQQVRIGEPLHYELLHVPDTAKESDYQVQLNLKDASGRVRLALPIETFRMDRMRTISYKIPSEQFADTPAVYPELLIKNTGKAESVSSFDATLLHPSVCKNYKYTRQPLREKLHPEKDYFHVTDNHDGTYRFSAAVQSPEELASVEILDCGKEIYSYDVANEFDRSKKFLVRGVFTTMFPTFSLTGDIFVRNSASWNIRSGNAAWESFRDGMYFDNVLKVKTMFTECRSMFFLSVSLEDVNRAALVIDYDKLGIHEFSLASLKENGKYSKNLPHHVRLDLERMDDLPDYPVNIGHKDVSFDTVLYSENRTPVFQLRAVSLSGKIYRSAPFPMPLKSGIKQKVDIYSEYSEKTESCEVPQERIPVLTYRFTPEYGDLLKCDYEPRWDISLGGGWVYAQPAWTGKQRFMPQNFRSIAPEWKKENERWILRFDGNGSYMILPIESIPRSSPFRIEFEIRMTDAKNQVLLRSGAAGYYGSLQLFVENGMLKGHYFGLSHTPKNFMTGLKVPLNRWCRITIEKDFATLSLAVDGNKEQFSYDRRGLFYQHHTFGGDLSPGAGLPENAGTFAGDLRSLKIEHLNQQNHKEIL